MNATVETKTPPRAPAARHILHAARQLIADGWCQRSYAQGCSGSPLNCLSPDASRFCAVGAIFRAATDLAPSSVAGPPGVYAAADAAVRTALLRLREALPSRRGRGGLTATDTMKIGRYNDTPDRTQAEMLLLFDAALAAEEAEGGCDD